MRSKPWLISAALVLLLSFSFPAAGPEPAYAGIADDKFLGNVIADYIPSDFATYWDQVTRKIRRNGNPSNPPGAA